MFININKATNSTEETNETNLSSQNTVILQHDYVVSPRQIMQEHISWKWT